ncbi:MAG: hypothetical protein ACRC4X_07130, partial [Cetobacterium sp.]
QGNFSSETLALYVSVEKNSIQKNIIQINEFLKDNKLNTIEIKDSQLRLTLTKEEWESIFSRKDFITSVEILDYLFVKFVHNKFINLEVEKENLDLSRSSIVRYFKDIKKLLDESGTTYSYQSGKGLRITHVSDECKNIFCKKLVKFFINRDFSIKPDSLHSQFLSQYNFLNLLEKIHITLDSAGILSTNFVISFLCTLLVLQKTLGGFDLTTSDSNLQKYSDLKDIIDKNMSEYDENYRDAFFFFSINIKNNLLLFEEKIAKKGKLLLNEIKTNFGFVDLDKDLENILLRKMCISLFKYENNILKVKNFPITKSDKIILNVLDELLKKVDLELFFFDKISITNIIKKIIIEHNKSLVKDVLLLFNEITISDDHYLKNNLKLKAPQINFYIQPTFFYKLNSSVYNQKYNLVLSDESYMYQNIKVINSYNSSSIINIIDNHILE